MLLIKRTRLLAPSYCCGIKMMAIPAPLWWSDRFSVRILYLYMTLFICHEIDFYESCLQNNTVGHWVGQFWPVADNMTHTVKALHRHIMTTGRGGVL